MQYQDDDQQHEVRTDLEQKVRRLEAAMSFVAMKAGAGICQASAGGKHEFLKDIRERCEAEGWDVLGRKRNP